MCVELAWNAPAARVRAAKSHLLFHAAINCMDFELLVSFLATIMVNHFPLFFTNVHVASFMSYSFSASTEASARAVL